MIKVTLGFLAGWLAASVYYTVRAIREISQAGDFYDLFDLDDDDDDSPFKNNVFPFPTPNQ